MRLYRDRYLICDVRSRSGASVVGPVVVEAHLDSFDQVTHDGKKLTLSDPIRGHARIVNIIVSNPFEHVDDKTKILWLEGSGEAFMLPSSGQLVHIESLFAGRLKTSFIRARMGVSDSFDYKSRAEIIMPRTNEKLQLRELRVNTELWREDNLDINLDKFQISGLDLKRVQVEPNSKSKQKNLKQNDVVDVNSLSKKNKKKDRSKIVDTSSSTPDSSSRGRREELVKPVPLTKPEALVTSWEDEVTDEVGAKGSDELEPLDPIADTDLEGATAAPFTRESLWAAISSLPQWKALHPEIGKKRLGKEIKVVSYERIGNFKVVENSQAQGLVLATFHGDGLHGICVQDSRDVTLVVELVIDSRSRLHCVFAGPYPLT